MDGQATMAHFKGPWALADDGAGALYVGEIGNNDIRKLSLGGASVSTAAGDSTKLGGSDGVGSAALFHAPTGLARSGGVLYIADTENHTIRKLDLGTQSVSLYAGTMGVAGSADGSAASALFREPEGLAADKSGQLYVGDVDNHVLRRIDLLTGMVSTVAGQAGTAGNLDGLGSGARFNKPTALAWDATSGDLFIADSGNFAVRRFHPANASVTTLITLSTTPLGLAIDGAAVVVSTEDHRLVRVAMAGGASTPLAGAANSGGFVDGIGAAARFSSPAGLWSDGAGHLYVADYGNHVLRRLDLGTAEVTTVAGAKSAGNSDGTGTAARFTGPIGVVSAGSGLFFVTDTYNHTLRQVVAATGVVTTAAGSVGQSGQSDGPALTARFNHPQGLAFDFAGHLFVADTDNHSVRQLDLDSGQVTTLTLYSDVGAQLMSPTGIAVSGGRLLVSEPDAHVVLSIDLTADSAGHKLSVLAGAAGMAGATDGVGASARFGYPQGLAADGRGNVYVCDVYNQSIRQIAIATAQVTTIADGLLGGNFGSDPPWNYPTQLAANGVGDLFVADSLNKVVRHVALSSGAVSIAVGDRLRSGVLLGPLPGQLGYPSGLALTEDGQLAMLSENSLLLAH